MSGFNFVGLAFVGGITFVGLVIVGNALGAVAKVLNEISEMLKRIDERSSAGK